MAGIGPADDHIVYTIIARPLPSYALEHVFSGHAPAHLLLLNTACRCPHLAERTLMRCYLARSVRAVPAAAGCSATFCLLCTEFASNTASVAEADRALCRYGPVEWVKLQRDAHYGMIRFHSSGSAAAAVDGLNGTEVCGQALTVLPTDPLNSVRNKRPRVAE